ncbi:YisL family protein [Oceanobacillus massiliensis]|uniref:YisL family protein n=1 Tax=Oceanobacillus massiliensis TaxID=1465765 RepID=UPI00028A36A6|nr:YisL family protein [Oceanobacillus massiliensis]
MTHMHITSWVIAFILFILVIAMQDRENVKNGKILHMILRLDYLFILYTGGDLLWNYISTSEMPILAEAITKGIAGIWLIAAMEMILVKKGKRKSAKSAWVQFWIALIIVLVLGFIRLPMGVQL